MRYCFLNSPDTSKKGQGLVKALYNSAILSGKDAALVKEYDPCDVLVLYGMGGKLRLQPALDHVKSGGTLVAFDLGYWGRTVSLATRKYRVSINGMHCPQYIMRGDRPGPQRWTESGMQTWEHYNENGPIVIAGIGPKSNALGLQGWTKAMSEKIRKRFPDKKIIYRPKPRGYGEAGVICDTRSIGGTIDDALKGASLLVCLHSNTAVDACRMGIPVVCESGAAASIYPNRLEDYKNQPSEAIRTDFLHRIAWWQWSIDEISTGRMWPWLDGQLADI